MKPLQRLSRRAAILLMAGAFLTSPTLADTVSVRGQTAKVKVTSEMIANGIVLPFKIHAKQPVFKSLTVTIKGPRGTAAKFRLGPTKMPTVVEWKLTPEDRPGKYRATWKGVAESGLSATMDTEMGEISPACMPGGANYPC
jgi:hypothetical protein